MARGQRRSKAHGPSIGNSSAAADEYGRWELARLEVDEQELLVASKPGVPGHGGLDPARGLLLDHLEIEAGERLLDLNCGAGAVGTFAARLADGARVEMYDRNLLAVEASKRTLAANLVADVPVHFAPAPAPDGHLFDVVCIRLPQGRLPTLHLLWSAFHALRTGGRCYLAGANDEGIRTALRQLDEIFGSVELLGYRGGNRVGLALRPESLPPGADRHRIPWIDPEEFLEFEVPTPAGNFRIGSRPGIFSWDRLDAGSEALMRVMRVDAGESVLELGCGYGIVGMAAARMSGSGRCVLVDVDSEAIRAARRNVAANALASTTEVIASDVAAALLEQRFDVVITNPPFHLQKQTNLDIPARFIHDAAAVLSPGGRLYLVANRTLPYERWLQDRFGAYEIAHDGREFKVLSARQPASE